MTAGRAGIRKSKEEKKFGMGSGDPVISFGIGLYFLFPSTPVLFRLSKYFYKSIKWMGLYGVTAARSSNTMNFAVLLEMVEQLNWHSSARREMMVVHSHISLSLYSLSALMLSLYSTLLLLVIISTSSIGSLIRFHHDQSLPSALMVAERERVTRTAQSFPLLCFRRLYLCARLSAHTDRPESNVHLDGLVAQQHTHPAEARTTSNQHTHAIQTHTYTTTVTNSPHDARAATNHHSDQAERIPFAHHLLAKPPFCRRPQYILGLAPGRGAHTSCRLERS